MAAIQQRVLILAVCVAAALPADAPKPPGKIKPSDFHEFRDFIANTFGRPGQRHSKHLKIPSQNVNAAGEVTGEA